jgi:hypothetical protein
MPRDPEPEPGEAARLAEVNAEAADEYARQETPHD